MRQKTDAAQKFKDADGKTCGNDRLDDDAEHGEDADAQRGRQKNCSGENGGKQQQREQIHQQRKRGQPADESSGKASERDGDDAAEQSQQHVAVQCFRHAAEGEGDRERYGTAHHRRYDHRMERADCFIPCGFDGKRCTAHVVCKQDRRQNRRVDP